VRDSVDLLVVLPRLGGIRTHAHHLGRLSIRLSHRVSSNIEDHRARRDQRRRAHLPRARETNRPPTSCDRPPVPRPPRPRHHHRADNSPNLPITPPRRNHPTSTTQQPHSTPPPSQPLHIGHRITSQHPPSRTARASVCKHVSTHVPHLSFGLFPGSFTVNNALRPLEKSCTVSSADNGVPAHVLICRHSSSRVARENTV